MLVWTLAFEARSWRFDSFPWSQVVYEVLEYQADCKPVSERTDRFDSYRQHQAFVV